jgi:rRNA large subunit m3Psi methyltransferase RlmH
MITPNASRLSSKSSSKLSKPSRAQTTKTPQRSWLLSASASKWLFQKMHVSLRSMSGGQDVALIIGGPDGLDPLLRQSAHESIRLSDMTLPHAFARVLLVEQLYRAWSINAGHPYHRE